MIGLKQLKIIIHFFVQNGHHRDLINQKGKYSELLRISIY